MNEMGNDRLPTREEARDLLRPGCPGQAEIRGRADAVRARVKGHTVRLRALIEFSNRCVRNCLYCGLRRDNESLERYGLEPEVVVRLAVGAAEAGYATVVLQAGEDPAYSRGTLARMVASIKERAPGMAVTLSVGEHGYDDYRAWRAAGADRYLLKHETSDPDIHARLRPGQSLEQRLRCAEWLKELGYEVGLGNMVGLPGQTAESLLADLELMARFEPEMVGIGPFVPHPATPLAAEPTGSIDVALNLVALTRLALPTVHIPATTALATLDRQAREQALRGGADIMMVNVGPHERRSLYQIYPGRGKAAFGAAGDSPAEQRRLIVEWLAGLGRTVDTLAGGRVLGIELPESTPEERSAAQWQVR